MVQWIGQSLLGRELTPAGLPCVGSNVLGPPNRGPDGPANGPQIVTVLESGDVDMATLKPSDVRAVKAQPDLSVVVGRS